MAKNIITSTIKKTINLCVIGLFSTVLSGISMAISMAVPVLGFTFGFDVLYIDNYIGIV